MYVENRIGLDRRVQFVDFRIGYSDETARPVFPAVEFPDKAAAIAQSVDLNQSAGRLSGLFGKSHLIGIRIRNSKVFMKIAVWIAIVDPIRAFGRFVVAFQLLGANGIAS